MIGVGGRLFVTGVDVAVVCEACIAVDIVGSMAVVVCMSINVGSLKRGNGSVESDGCVAFEDTMNGDATSSAGGEFSSNEVKYVDVSISSVLGV